MSRQDKTTSERHTRTLRELVKRPENKVCADCKRNDPRWASWNLGVFLCIRCSGIHRGMGTHISKVKSVDLDVWTPEQMKSIQLWGNTRANLYWEAHLKPGHIPPDHKMESFIRSKYESRRWALEGSPPEDPSTLENGHEPNYSEPATPAPQQQQPHPLRTPTITAQPTQQQRQSHTRLPTQARPKQSAASQNQPAIATPPQSTATAQKPAVTSPQDDLFSLDFRAPSTSTSATSSAGSSATAGPKDVKNDILSLFATAPPPGSGILGGGFGDGSVGFGTAQPQAQAQLQPTSMMGSSGTGVWGVQSGWNGMQTGQAQQAQTQIWSQPAQPQQQQQPFGGFSSNAQPQSAGLFGSQNVWGSRGSTGATQTGMDLFSTPFSSTAAAQPVKKDDAFGDLWGSFK